MVRRVDDMTRLSAQRWKFALILSAIMVAIYFGFMLLVAFPSTKAWLGTTIFPGLSWGILLGAIVILLAWGLTFIYIRWANTVYDPRVKVLLAEHRDNIKKKPGEAS